LWQENFLGGHYVAFYKTFHVVSTSKLTKPTLRHSYDTKHKALHDETMSGKRSLLQSRRDRIGGKLEEIQNWERDNGS